MENNNITDCKFTGKYFISAVKTSGDRVLQGENRLCSTQKQALKDASELRKKGYNLVNIQISSTPQTSYFEKTTLIPINDDLGLIMNAAVRYAIGRMTYMPGAVVDFITPYLSEINDRTLDCFIRDLEERMEDVEKGIGTWGMDIDKATWINFLNRCRQESVRRNLLV